MNTMNLENQNLQSALHAVLVPFPSPSHVNSLMNLAHLLVTRGFFITFVTTESIHKRRVGVSATNANSFISLDYKGDPDHEPGSFCNNIRFLCIPEGLAPNQYGPVSNSPGFLLALQKLSPALEHLLRSSSGNDEKYSVPPITCIVTDPLMSCTEQVATNMKVPRVIFWPICAAASITQCYTTLLISQGHIPVRMSEANNPEKLITCLPGNLPPLRPTDLISIYRAHDPSDAVFNAYLYESQKQSKGDYVLVNTFDELEGRDTLLALSYNGCPALAIGPLFLPNFLQRRDSAISLREEEEDGCLQWLDMQQPESVIFVSFGNVALKSQEQLVQLALGLECSGQAFLWVLRHDIAQGKPAVLPEGFEERTKGRRLLVSWVPQVKVLAHRSVGLFLTHGGWNSILESISMGVPVLGFPYGADQFLNCRFAKEVWKIGLDFEGVDVDEHKLVTKEEVEDMVRRMMKTPEGEQLRKNAVKLKECAAKAVLPGGSSFQNLNAFVREIGRKGKAQPMDENSE